MFQINFQSADHPQDFQKIIPKLPPRPLNYHNFVYNFLLEWSDTDVETFGIENITKINFQEQLDLSHRNSRKDLHSRKSLETRFHLVL